jgi:putative Ca2+/H+ antiporter (TMEM165/GDT1 family)
MSEALRYNILLVTLGIPLAAWFWSEQFAVLLTGHRFRSPVRASWVAWTLLAVLLLFAVLRNIPGDVFAILRPPG